MTIKRKSLGGNLSALLSQSNKALLNDAPHTVILYLAVDCLKPGKYQPRTLINERSLEELS